MGIRKNLTDKCPIRIEEGKTYLSKSGHKIIIRRRNLGFYITFYGVVGVNGVRIHGTWDEHGKWEGGNYFPGDFDVASELEEKGNED